MPEPKDWIVFAKADLKVAKNSSIDDELVSIAMYHAHQSIEKSLKTILIHHGQVVPKKHDLDFLLKKCIEYNFSMQLFKESILFVNQFGSETRYPDDFQFIKQDDLLKAIQIAEKILKVVAQYVHVKI